MNALKTQAEPDDPEHSCGQMTVSTFGAYLSPILDARGRVCQIYYQRRDAVREI
jgi:hypothetical protein